MVAKLMMNSSEKESLVNSRTANDYQSASSSMVRMRR
jgi:hypothetical protein